MEKHRSKTVVLGIGNRLRKDDAAGSIVAELLKDKDTDILAIDSETTPENWTGKIARMNPEKIIIVDTANFNGKPGDFRILRENQIDWYGFSTHTLPISFVIEDLKSRCSAEITLLGIQPKNTDFGEDISPEVKKSIHIIKEMILDKKI